MSDEKLDTQVRREQIAQAALELVASQGLRKLSVAAVARRVGLVPSGLYRHYQGKEEMLAAVLDLLERKLMDNVHAARQEGQNPLEQLRGLLVRHIRAIRENRALPRIVFSDDVHAGHPQRRDRVLQIVSRYMQAVAEIIVEGQKQRLIPKEVDPETGAMVFFGMIAPAALRWHLTEGGFDVTRHAERAWKFFAAALTTPSAK